jgi:hypothetical protein
MRTWDWHWFGTKESKQREHILIDSRIDDQQQYGYDRPKNKVWLSATPSHKWTPLVVMDYSERFEGKEFETYAQVLVDRLNAYEVEKKLKGEG